MKSGLHSGLLYEISAPTFPCTELYWIMYPTSNYKDSYGAHANAFWDIDCIGDFLAEALLQ